MTRTIFAMLAAVILTLGTASVTSGSGPRPQVEAATLAATPNSRATRAIRSTTLSAAPVLYWSNEARRAIVPPSAGPENFGNKFPGEAGVYMGIVHVAIYDAALAIEGGYEPYAIGIHAPDASSAAAVATAAHHVLVGLQPAVGLNVDQQAILDGDYVAYVASIPEGDAKAKGIEVGRRVADAVLALRRDDDGDKNPRYGEPPFVPPPEAAGVWRPDAARPVLGLRIPGITPLALEAAWQFRPDGPNPLTSTEYAEDLAQLEEVGGSESTARTPAQTAEALFWTDHDARQWNDGLLGIATTHELGLVKAARMLAMAHVAGGDALIACFDAKYHYWFWRPYQAIAGAAEDGNPLTEPVVGWTSCGRRRTIPSIRRRTPATRAASRRRSQRSSVRTGRTSRSRSTAASLAAAALGTTTASVMLSRT